jgi:hypothetical protein
MGRFFHVITFGAVTILAPELLFSQGGGAETAGGSFSSSMSSSGFGGTVSSSGNGNQTTFTYNYPSGGTVFAIANAPYSGHMSSQNVRTLANGVHLNMQTNDQPMTYRDSMGRTRTDAEMSPARTIAPASANLKPHILRLPEISDPVAGFRYVLDDANRIAHRIAIQTRQNQTQARAVPGTRAPVAQTRPRVTESGVTSTSESLGTQSMFGITVAGQRTTTTYPPGTYQGNDGQLTSSGESWRSDQYGLMLLSKNSQPDGGESSTTMKDFSAAEPDPTLFMVPAGYQIADETGQFTITLSAREK